jgi:hypothetical protein
MGRDVARLAEDEEPERTRGEARGGGGLGQESVAAMKTRTDFAHRIDKLNKAGEILEHVAGVEDFGLAEAVYRAARKHWPRG